MATIWLKILAANATYPGLKKN